MKALTLRNVALMAVVASWFLQIGGQLFALVAVDRILVAAPPQSFAMLQGAYHYDSEPFWNVVPMITTVLLIVAAVTNWRTPRRKHLMVALALYIVVALVSTLYLEPTFNELKAVGFRDEVDVALQAQAAKWHAAEWAVWGVALLGGLSLLLALVLPVPDSREVTPSKGGP